MAEKIDFLGVREKPSTGSPREQLVLPPYLAFLVAVLGSIQSLSGPVGLFDGLMIGGAPGYTCHACLGFTSPWQ